MISVGVQFHLLADVDGVAELVSVLLHQTADLVELLVANAAFQRQLLGAHLHFELLFRQPLDLLLHLRLDVVPELERIVLGKESLENVLFDFRHEQRQLLVAAAANEADYFVFLGWMTVEK